MKNKIDILLATYNGSRYIESQILSLIGQTYKDWRLIIHDDGSTDGTIEIISEFKKRDSRISIIEDSIILGGAAKNFLHLLSFSTADFIIFCDQDDIWFESKLGMLMNCFENKTTKDPRAVFCNGFPYSEDSGILDDKITRIFPTNLKEQLFLNSGIQGCSLMFNIELKKKLSKIPDVIAMHDHFITLGAICFGTLEYLEKSLMLYRQFHENKVTANMEFSLVNRIKSIFISNIPVIDRLHRDATKSFYQVYEKELNSDQIKLFKAYFQYSLTSSLFKRLLIVIKNGFKIYNSVSLLILKTLTRKPIN